MNFQIAEKIKVKTAIKKRRREQLIDLWAQLPIILRVVAAGGLILTVLAVTIGYLRLRNNKDFVMMPGPPQLSMNIIAVVNGYERRVTEGDKLQLIVRADREITFDDGRHELDNVVLENYPENSIVPDRITALKAVYQPDPSNPENFTVNFLGNVHFATRDGLKAVTEQILYNREQEFAETSAALKFNRDNIEGSAVGARLSVKNKHFELLNQVEINVLPEGNLAKNSLTDFGSSHVRINASRASFEQDLAQFELEQNVNIVVTPQKEGDAQTTIRAETAIYQKDTQKLDLSGRVEIVSASDNVIGLSDVKQKNDRSGDYSAPVTIRTDAASYEQGNGKIYLNGNASVQQGSELLMNGERITAEINRQKKLQAANTVGDAFLRSASAERMTTVNSAEMNFQFDSKQQIKLATAAGDVKIRSITGDQTIELTDADRLVLNFKPTGSQSLLERMTTRGDTNVILTAANSLEYSSVQMSAPNSTEVLFTVENDKSLIRQMTTGGRTIVVISAPQSQANNPKATNKKLIADSLKLLWNAAGKDLARTEATGNAELYIFPLQAGANLDKNSLFANRFDCDFYETGNLAKNFVASGKVKALLEPTVATPEKNTKTLSADKMIAKFERETQAVENFTAEGNSKFSELDRHGMANSFVYTAADETVRLRGGEPTVWDNKARLKAAEIDWNTRQETSNLRGRVATTYYSQEQTGGSTPFAKVNSPVYIVSNFAELNHATGVAVYRGNARAWQDSNFVRADKLILQRETKSMFGEGAVQSALYNVKRRAENNKEIVVPVFAVSERMSYSDTQKLLRYESKVEIRQGTDQITSGVAEVYLNAVNEVDKTLWQNNVIVTQPGRRATGDWAQYTAVDEVVILRGNPATVADAAQGASNGRQLTVYLRENRVEGQGGATATAPGRVRSTHKINKQ